MRGRQLLSEPDPKDSSAVTAVDGALGTRRSALPKILTFCDDVSLASL